MNQESKSKHILRRIFAFLFDYTIIFGLFFLVAYNWGQFNDEGGYTLSGFMTLIPISGWFIFTVLMEQMFGGTLGNLMVDLKVYNINGLGRPSFGQSFGRHFFDMLDFNIIGLIVVLTNKEGRRMGDLVSQTIVIKTAYNKT